MGVSLSDFEDADRRTIKWLYAELRAVTEMLRPDVGAMDGKALREHFQAPPWRSLISAMKMFGQATYEMRPDPTVKKVMHDLRGGPLAVLLLRLQAVGEKVGGAEVAKLSKLAREHLELMRTCVPDLEPDGHGGPGPVRPKMGR